MRVSPVLIPVLLIIVGISLVAAQSSIVVEVPGNGTIIIYGPANTVCNVSYRALEDTAWISSSSFVNQTIINLPWGKYDLNISCSNNETYRAIIENKPRWLFTDSLMFLAVLAMLTIIHLWRKAVVSAVLSIIFFWYYVSHYLNVFSAEVQGLLLFGYIVFALLLVIRRR